jgi:hypothetical protein
MAAGLSRSDEDSPSKYAEALLGKEAMNRQLKQFLECSKQVKQLHRHRCLGCSRRVCWYRAMAGHPCATLRRCSLAHP